jgi:hypothetical protein
MLTLLVNLVLLVYVSRRRSSSLDVKLYQAGAEPFPVRFKAAADPYAHWSGDADLTAAVLSQTEGFGAGLAQDAADLVARRRARTHLQFNAARFRPRLHPSRRIGPESLAHTGPVGGRIQPPWRSYQ